MTRTIGARDKQPRKTRSDLGGRHKTYRGKPVKTKTQIKRERKRIGNKNEIKLEAWMRVKMSKRGRAKWNPHMRKRIAPYVFPGNRDSPHRFYFTVSVKDIETIEKFERFFSYHLIPGEFYIFGRSRGKNRFQNKPVLIAVINIRDTSNGYKARITRDVRLHRYRWFFKDA